LSFLHAASDGTFPVLKTFSSLLVLSRVFSEIVVSASVLDLLLHVLLLLFGIAADERWVAVGVLTFFFFTGCKLLFGAVFFLGGKSPNFVRGLARPLFHVFLGGCGRGGLGNLPVQF